MIVPTASADKTAVKLAARIGRPPCITRRKDIASQLISAESVVGRRRCEAVLDVARHWIVRGEGRRKDCDQQDKGEDGAANEGDIVPPPVGAEPRSNGSVSSHQRPKLHAQSECGVEVSLELCGCKRQIWLRFQQTKPYSPSLKPEYSDSQTPRRLMRPPAVPKVSTFCTRLFTKIGGVR